MNFSRSTRFLIASTLGIALSSMTMAAIPCPPITENTPMVTVGNAIIKQAALETVIRSVLANTLSGVVANNTLHFQIDPMNQTVVLPPPTPELKPLLDILGIKEKLNLSVASTHAVFTLPNSALKISIQNTAENSFLVKAKWSLTRLDAVADSLSINVPPGFFDQAITIISHPVKFGLRPKSTPVEFIVTLTADLTDRGTKIKLQSVKTNLEAKNHPDFSAKIGALSVDKKPMQLDVKTNGQTLVWGETEIRGKLQKLEQSYTDLIRKSLSDMIQSQVADQMKSLESNPPFQYHFKTDDFISEMPALDDNMKLLMSGIDFTLIPSKLQAIPSSQIYLTEVSSRICLDGKCLKNQSEPSLLQEGDLATVTYQHQSSVLLYETFFQSLIQSSTFKKRVSDYFKKTTHLPGASLAPAGVKIYFEPSMNAVIAIINLEIQIGKTATSANPWSTRLERSMGSFIESNFGSGKTVKIPVPIAFKLDSVTQNEKGETNVNVSSDLSSLKEDGTFIPYSRCSPTDCPNNISEMTQFVRDDFIPIVKQDLSNAIPAKISIPFGTDIRFKNLAFQLKQLLITPNHGFLVNARTLSAPGDQKP